MSYSWFAAIAVVGTIMTAPSLARAGDTSTAEKLFEEGVAALKRDDYKAACEAFAGSNEADPSSGTEINLGFCNDKLGKVATAWGWYKTAASLARERRQSDRADLALKEAARLEQLLPKLHMTTNDPASGLTIMRDGTPLPLAAIGRDVPIDPGSHNIEVSAKGKKTWVGTVDIPTGPHVTRFEVPPLEDASEATASTIHAGGGSPASQDTSKDRTNQRTLGYVLGGTGIVAAGVAIGFGVVSISQANKRKDYDNTLNNLSQSDVNYQATQSSRDSYAKAAKNDRLVAIIAGAGGVVLIGTGIWLALTPSSSSKSGNLEGPHVVPLIGGGTTGLGFNTTF